MLNGCPPPGRRNAGWPAHASSAARGAGPGGRTPAWTVGRSSAAAWLPVLAALPVLLPAVPGLPVVNGAGPVVGVPETAVAPLVAGSLADFPRTLPTTADARSPTSLLPRSFSSAAFGLRTSSVAFWLSCWTWRRPLG